jgi:hypothetical protein
MSLLLKTLHRMRLLLWLGVALPIGSHAQHQGTDSVPPATGNLSALMLSVAPQYAVFRDQATSPLFYSGFGVGLAAGHLWEWNRWEHHAELNASIAFTGAEVPRSTYFGAGGSALMLRLGMYDHLLYRIDAL